MGIHFGWYATRGTGPTVPTQNDVETKMDGSGMDVCMSFGVRTLPTITEYVSKVDSDILDATTGYLGATTEVKLILDLWDEALDELRSSSTSTDMTTIKNDLGGDSKVWGYHIEEPNYASYEWPSDTSVRRSNTILNNKPLVVNVRPGGNVDATDPLDPYPVRMDKRSVPLCSGLA